MNVPEVVALAKRHGFHRAAVVAVSPAARADAYQAWLDAATQQIAETIIARVLTGRSGAPSPRRVMA